MYVGIVQPLCLTLTPVPGGQKPTLSQGTWVAPGHTCQQICDQAHTALVYMTCSVP